jgi:hypothetical protein
LLTGLDLALGTQWGLFRHYWILVKFLLTIGATIVLLVHTNAMREAASIVSVVAAETLSGVRTQLGAGSAGGLLGNLQLQLLVASGGGLLVLLVNTTLGLYKPRGLTRYGRRKQQERRIATKGTTESSRNAPDNTTTAEGMSLRLKITIAVIVLIVATLVFLHLSGAGFGNHGR